MNTDLATLVTDNLVGAAKGFAAGAGLGAILYDSSPYILPPTFLHKLGLGAALSFGADLVAKTGINLVGDENWQNNLGVALGFAGGYTLAEKIKDYINRRREDN